MTIAMRYSPQLELNLAEYRGEVSLAELKVLAAWGAPRTDYLRRDCLSVVTADADFSSIDLTALDALFSRYRSAYAPLEFQIFRRSAWVCLNPAARRHVDYWLGERDIRETMSSATRQFETYEEAADWLLLSDAELAQVIRGDGVEELAAFEIPPTIAPTLSR